jgi:hypothetical protein
MQFGAVVDRLCARPFAIAPAVVAIFLYRHSAAKPMDSDRVEVQKSRCNQRACAAATINPGKD